ncbi:hypothetical protein FO519_000395 [Halicephalobus sp. NKZ332]|nr:hypothetical protein FO519_000395 [Halicephalobus sp. NKZ332]
MIQSCCVRRKSSSIQEQYLLSRIGGSGDFRILDLSDLNLHILPDIIVRNSQKIEHLILDENELEDNFLENCTFSSLKTLSVNSNKITNIGVFLHQISWRCPNLVFLSLIGNPGWPHPIIGNNVELYKTVAQTVTRFLPGLQFLDSMPTSVQET